MMEGGPHRRLACKASIGEILLIGEQLRVVMHTENCHLVKDRRYHLRSYSSCFQANETVDWLVHTKQAPDREVACWLMNILLHNKVFHHVTQTDDQTTFKDDNSYCRFRKDDGTFPWHEDVSIFARGQRLYQRLKWDRLSVMSDHNAGGSVYPQSMFGNELISWMVQTKEVASREDALKEGRRLLENDIIRHITDSHHFKDEALLYQFKTDFDRKFELLELLGRSNVHKNSTPKPNGVVNKNTEEKAALNIPREKKTERAESGYHSLQGDDLNSSPSNSGSPPIFGSMDSMDSQKGRETLQISSTLLIRTATAEELEDPRSLYKRRTLRIASDPVGFGFVIRGDGPVYVKTVDPTGPAALAGLKVGHYIYKVNDQKVLHLNHRELALVILSCDGYLRLDVMEYLNNHS